MKRRPSSASLHLRLRPLIAAIRCGVSLLLAVVLSIPLAHLFELCGNTIWAPALLHFVIQGTAKVIVFPDSAATSFALAWMIAGALLPMAVLLVPRRGTGIR